MEKEAKATLTGSRLVTLKELEAIPTPERTETWKPVPHIVVPRLIDSMVDERSWSFVDPENRYQFAVSKEGDKLFGVTKVVIPGVDVGDEFQMAIGFRNSHDKTLALRIAVGASVFVCDNLIITGDMQVRRIHTGGIDPEKRLCETPST